MPFWTFAVEDQEFCILLDTGSSHSFITPRGRDIIGAQEVDPGVEIEVTAFNSQQRILCEQVQIYFWTTTHNCYVVPEIMTIQPATSIFSTQLGQKHSEFLLQHKQKDTNKRGYPYGYRQPLDTGAIN